MRSSVTAVILAGGRGQRLSADAPKVHQLLRFRCGTSASLLNCATAIATQLSRRTIVVVAPADGQDYAPDVTLRRAAVSAGASLTAAIGEVTTDFVLLIEADRMVRGRDVRLAYDRASETACSTITVAAVAGSGRQIMTTADKASGIGFGSPRTSILAGLLRHGDLISIPVADEQVWWSIARAMIHDGALCAVETGGPTVNVNRLQDLSNAREVAAQVRFDEWVAAKPLADD